MMKIGVENLSFSFGEQPLLSKLSFSIQEGEFLCVLGPNGIGKTTLLKCLMGFYKPQEGRIFLNGETIPDLSLLKEVAYVPQARRLDFSYTALEMTLMGRSKYVSTFSSPSAQDRDIALSALEEIGIEDLAHSSCSQMSGGELQMVYLARALAARPKFLVLDEPEAHLDFRNQQKVLDKIHEMVRKRKMLCLMNTHHPQHALDMADGVLLLGEGGEYYLGKAEEGLRKDIIERFFGVSSSLVDVEVEDIKKKIFVLLNRRSN